MKAQDVVTIDLQDKSAIGDFMVVASGTSNRHVAAISNSVTEALEKAGIKGLRIEGMPHCDWVAIDAGDIIIHVFRPEVRSFYAIEKMWMNMGQPQAKDMTTSVAISAAIDLPTAG